VVQNLLSFARQRKPQKALVDICKVLDETLALRDYDLKVNDIQVERRDRAGFPPSPPTHTNWNRCFSTSSTMAWTPCWKSAGEDR